MWVSGLRYEGGWLNDKTEGDGVATYANGDKYTGEFHGDLRCVEAHGRPCSCAQIFDVTVQMLTRLPSCPLSSSGWGRFDMANGDSYEGMWKEDVIHGKVRAAAPSCGSGTR